MAKTKIVFFGTPEIATQTLRALAQAYHVTLVITQPDKALGREQKTTATPVKITAEKLGLPVIQPKNAEEVFRELKNFNADLGVLFGYGMILPERILHFFPFGILNIHPSLLPRYRGATPVQAALWNGENETGVTIIKLTQGMDAGPIIAQVKTPIQPDETYPSLAMRLASLGTKLFIDTLPRYISGKCQPKTQNAQAATYCQTLRREDGKIDWRRPAQEIYNQYRALLPWPGIFTFWNKKRLKLQGVTVLRHASQTPGKVFYDDTRHILAVACGSDALGISSVQLEGKKNLPAKDFIQGQAGIIGSILG